MRHIVSDFHLNSRTIFENLPAGSLISDLGPQPRRHCELNGNWKNEQKAYCC